MTATPKGWVARNAWPIIIVIVAAVVVIAGVEVLDAFVGGEPATATPGNAEDGPADALAIAALIKPLLFLGVGAALTFGVRRLIRACTAVRTQRHRT
ncbi:hypothetical protein [Euzebya pacifica]|uniref:hypothetical protein n=1 Tax=Euzebya pacifica TaxID=1608957 RepID=UPI000DF766C1|nr:hypothetical protein [Euzebya pacifica]